MGSLKGVEITTGSVGASSAAPDTAPSALISNAPAIANNVIVNTVYEITTVAQAEALGITSDYDIQNDVVLHQHIVDFFSMVDEGTSFRFMLTDAATPADSLADVNLQYAKKLIVAADGAIRNFSLGWNIPAASDPETLIDGMNGLIRAAIPQAQLLADWAADTNRPIHVFLEGRRLSDTLSSALNLRNILVSGVLLEAPNVSIVAGQDWDYAEARKTNANVPINSKVHYYAAVGKVLGTVASAEMNQSIGEVATFNLSDAVRGYFLTGGLSNHMKLQDVDDFLSGLDDNGYIFPISLKTSAISGLRWNNDHVCIPIVIDADGNINEHMIYYVRTMNEATRSLRDSMLLQLKRRYPANPSTGQLTTASVKLLESVGNKVFSSYVQYGFISDGTTTVDATSDLITPPKTLLVDFEIVPTLILDNISGTVRLKKSITV